MITCKNGTGNSGINGKAGKNLFNLKYQAAQYNKTTLGELNI